MRSPIVVTSTWGYPTTTKQVLLLHGLTGSSQFWNRVAQDFASRGYFVTAPDLLGHGLARRSSLCTFAAMVEEIRPLLVPAAITDADGEDHPYDIVVGYSLGAIVACVLLPFLRSTRQVSVVLVDPPLELDAELIAFYRELFSQVVQRPEMPEVLLQQNILWTKEDAAISALGAQLCDVGAVQAIFDQNIPWSFSQTLKTIPENIKVTVLAADPSKGPRLKEDDLKAFPHITTKTVWGASHAIPVEFPEVVVEAALGAGRVGKQDV